jgi:hypothetical protein
MTNSNTLTATLKPRKIDEVRYRENGAPYVARVQGYAIFLDTDGSRFGTYRTQRQAREDAKRYGIGIR